jgi:hypothetical protein
MKVPGIGDITLINLSSFTLPPDLDVDLGPLPLAPALLLPKGSWEMNSQVHDATSGVLIAEDINPFQVN